MSTVTVPVAEYLIEAAPPLVIQSCVLAPPPPAPDPEPEEAIFTPVAPGITAETLPTIPTIIDTSPDQVIGCANDVGPDPQSVLNALFPAAISGDGVVDRTTNDFWVYDGTTWNNVGPNPGPTLTVTTTVPPWNEILLYTSRLRTRLRARSFPYALSQLTEVDPLVVRVGLMVRPVLVLDVPAAEYELEALAPDVDILDSSFSAVAMPYSYTGNGTEQSITDLFRPGMVWLRSTTSTVGDGENYVYDALRGPTRTWNLNSPNQELTDAQTVTAFNADGFSVGSSNIVNQSGATYIGHVFQKLQDPKTNTNGTITSQVAKSEAYSVITYTGNGTAGATIGHGLDADPQMIWVKRLNNNEFAVAGGKIIGDNYWMLLRAELDRMFNTALFRTSNTSTFTVGNGVTLNGSGSTYVAYAFKNVPHVSFLGTYVGDAATGGKYIECGFEVDFVLVKGRDGGTLFDSGTWLLFDREDITGKRFYQLDQGVPYEEEDVMCLFEDTGFRVDRGGASSLGYRDLNISGATYIFMAFSRRVATAIAPIQAIDVEPLAPSV